MCSLALSFLRLGAKPAASTAFAQQRLVLAGQTVARRKARRGCRRTGSRRRWSRARRSLRADRTAASRCRLRRAASPNHRCRSCVTMRDVGRDQILEPAVDLRGIEIVAVGMAQRNVDRRASRRPRARRRVMPQTWPSRHGQDEPRSARSPGSLVSVSSATMPTPRRSGSSRGVCQVMIAPGRVRR